MKKELNKKQLKKSTGGTSKYDVVIEMMHQDLDKLIKDGTIEAGKDLIISKAYLAAIAVPLPPHTSIMPITYEDLEKEANRYIRERTIRFW